MRVRKNLVVDALSEAFLGGAGLRREDAQKACELTALLEEIASLVAKRAKRAKAAAQGPPFVLIDACAGKAALGVLASALVLRDREHQVIAVERDASRRARCLEAARILGVAERIAFVAGDVSERAVVDAWPRAPDLVVALHACGGASDAVIDAAIACEARALLLVPCCYGAGPRHAARDGDGGGAAALPVRAQALGDAWAARVPLPKHSAVGKRFTTAIVDAERTLRLEAHGYETEVVEAFAPTISPHNLVWRARRVGEPVRTARARAQLDELARG